MRPDKKINISVAGLKDLQNIQKDIDLLKAGIQNLQRKGAQARFGLNSPAESAIQTLQSVNAAKLGGVNPNALAADLHAPNPDD